MTQVESTPAAHSAPSSATSPAAADVLARLRTTYDSGRTRPLEWREAQLDALDRMLVEGEDEIVAAVVEDLGRPAFEAWAAEIAVVRREIGHQRKGLRKWARPERVRTSWLTLPSKAEIHHEPLGVVLVIAPWNYPVHLMVIPLAAAIAAGNAAVCKPSEAAPATARTFARLLPRYLDPDAFTVVEGGIPETTALLEQRWDHIFYTGNGTIGRVVAEAAAKHLTPVTLELGGKTPVIVHRDADVDLAASRVAAAKFINAGQTCIATDHAYVHRDVEEQFVQALGKEIDRRYGSDPRQSKDFGRIVNSGHTARIKGLLDAGGFEETYGGQVDVEGRYVAPTVLRGVEADSAVMGEEIFGPVLPVLTFDDISEPIEAINAGDKPLTLYVFTGDDATADRVLSETSSGSACVNDTLSNMLVPALPFGGVGESGYGSYHGRWGFETFSHRKSVLRRPRRYPDPAAQRPPYSRWKQLLSRRMF